MFKMIKAYLFDWMGTLGYSSSRKKVGEEISRAESNLLMVNSLKKVIFDKNRRKEIHSLLFEDKHFLYEDSEQIVDFLKKRNYLVGIISNMYDISTRKIRKEFFSFISKFDITLFSCEVNLQKPQREIFIYAFDKLKDYTQNISLEEIMVIGDKIDKDIKPALALGMQARLIDRNKNNLSEII